MIRLRAGLAILASLIARDVAGQTIVESSSGTSSIVLKNNGIALINFGDKSVKLGYSSVVSTQPFRFGAELKARTSDDFAQLFGADAKPEGQARVFAGWLWEADTAAQHPAVPASWFTVELGYTRANLSLATANGASVARKDTTFTGTGVRAYYNLIGRNLVLPGDILVGLSAGYGQRNNYGSDALTKVSVCQTVATTGGATPTTATRCKDGKTGPYTETSDAVGAYDLIWYIPALKNRIAIDALGRYEAKATGAGFSPGFGLFVPEKGSPLNFLGGFTVEWQDGKPVTGFQVGIPF
jgi:hypothetical protein